MQHTTYIEKIVHGGLGLGRLENGMVCLTRLVAPGEKVVVREVEKRRGYIVTEAIDILEPSPDRITPPCPWYSQCGGCDLQHLTLEAQLKIKEGIVAESFKRACVTLSNRKILPIIRSPHEFHYRYRIRLKISPTGHVGFYRANTNDIVDIDHCPIATEAINRALQELRVSGFTAQHSHEISEIELLHNPSDDTVFCLLHPRNGSYAKEEIGQLKPMQYIHGIALTNTNSKPTVISGNQDYTLCQEFAASICGHSYSLHWSPGCFSQVNADQNLQLVKTVCHKLRDQNSKHVLDLFCGTGNFSIPMALQGIAVTGIEHSKESVNEANRNAKRFGLKNTRYLDNDVHKWLQIAAKKGFSFDTIILDPPRQGLGKNITRIVSLKPSRIVYISCDPATLARDIKYLEDQGFILTDVTPVDMFPQTHHIESIALLEKN